MKCEFGEYDENYENVTKNESTRNREEHQSFAVQVTHRKHVGVRSVLYAKKTGEP